MKRLFSLLFAILIFGCQTQQTTFTFTAIPDQDTSGLEERFGKIANYNFERRKLGLDSGKPDLKSRQKIEINIKTISEFEKILLRQKIEFRRGNAGGGNQLRQPYLKDFAKKISFKNFREVDHIHFFGYYIGNYPSLAKSKIRKICKILNAIKL